MNGSLLSIQNGGHALRNGYLPGKLHNWQTHAERQTALPNGNIHPYGWMLPRTGGAMSMRTEGEGALSANLIPTINGAIDFTGLGSLSANAALVISMFCNMTGSGTLTANITGLLNMSINLQGDGDLAANLSGIGNMLIDLEGSGDLAATIAAYGNMSIEIVVTGSGLTVENVRNAVWDALSANYDQPGTMGELLNSAGGAVDPGAIADAVWDEVLNDHTTTGTTGKKLKDALKTSDFIALK